MKHILTAVACFLTVVASAQTYNKWSVSLGIGNHFGLQPTSATSRAYNIQSTQVGGRYMFNPYIGIMLTAGYDFVDFDGMGSANSNIVRTDLQGVINIGALCNFSAKTSKFGLIYHSGFGGTHLWSKAYNRANAADPLFKNSDDMFNVVTGITPQFKLSSRFTLFVDYSFLVNFKQDMSYDFKNRLSGKGVGGNMHNVTIGLRFNIGSHSEHADWTNRIGQ